MGCIPNTVHRYVEGAPAAPDRPTLSSESATITELRLSDGDLPAGSTERTSLLMQVSAPIVVELKLDGRYQQRSLRPGDFCIAPPGPTPAARWRGERSILLVELASWLLGSVAESHHMPMAELPARIAVDDPQISHLLFALHAEFVNRNPSGGAYIDAISRAVALRLLTAHANLAEPGPLRGGLSRPSLRRVLEYIDTNLDQDLALSSLSAVSGLSADHFARAFRESTGEPPHRYLMRRRLAHARHLLENSDRSIADIAQTSGFTDQSHLTNLFRRHFGITPGKVRAAWTRDFGTAGIVQ